MEKLIFIFLTKEKKMAFCFAFNRTLFSVKPITNDSLWESEGTLQEKSKQT